LLKEYQERGRAGGIIDRRFGENDPSMSLEDRMLERFTRERQRASRGAMFNLDDDEEGEELTHYGQKLSLLEQEDDFEEAGLRLRENEDEEGKGLWFFFCFLEESLLFLIVPLGQIEAEVVKRAHFKGFDDEEEEEVRVTSFY
jgi:nucleolar protein 14